MPPREPIPRYPLLQQPTRCSKAEQPVVFGWNWSCSWRTWDVLSGWGSMILAAESYPFKEIKKAGSTEVAINERARNEKMPIKNNQLLCFNGHRHVQSLAFFFTDFPFNFPSSPAPNLDRKGFQSTLAHTKDVGISGRSIALNTARPGRQPNRWAHNGLLLRLDVDIYVYILYAHVWSCRIYCFQLSGRCKSILSKWLNETFLRSPLKLVKYILYCVWFHHIIRHYPIVSHCIWQIYI